uniref:receptor protein-tyrosine kinase n=1 Tax=Poecilia reticulata TaxID=8081 RepID=A0A3P9NWM6_POERE
FQNYGLFLPLSSCCSSSLCTLSLSLLQSFSLPPNFHLPHLLCAPYWTSPEKMKYNFHLVPAATTVKFRCAAGGYPQPTLRWLKNGRPFRQEDRMGGYKVGETLIHQTANTNIISASLFPLFAFHSDAQFQCNVYVYGESHFQWLRLVPRNGSRYGPDGPPYIKVLKSSNIPTDMEFLTITNVTEEDAGEYLCKVSNHQGEAVQSAWLCFLFSLPHCSNFILSFFLFSFWCKCVLQKYLH